MKSELTKKLEYWMRQIRRSVKLILWILLGTFAIIIAIILLLWIIPILLEFLHGVI